MRYLLCVLLCYFGRLIFKLRYKIKIKGFKELKKTQFSKKAGILFLPNHPALVDPIFITLYLWPKFRIHPLVVEYVYRQTGIHSIMKLVKAIAIPNLDTSLNEVKIKNAQGVIETIIKGLKERDNYILYPAGRLKHTGKEIVGGASATQAILSAVEDINVVLIRTTGLWGSSFSRAYTGRSPDFKSTVLRNIKYLMKSFFFFIPKRKVLIEIEVAKKDFPKDGTRLEVNKYLEKFYNQYQIDGEKKEEELLKKVSYSPFKEIFNEVQQKEEKKRTLTGKYDQEIEEKIFKELSRIQPDVEIEEKMHLAQDLGLDSLDVAELITFLSVNFDIGEVHPEEIETVRDVLEIASGTHAQKKEVKEVSTHTFPEETKRPALNIPEGHTIAEAFLHKCDKMKDLYACGDDIIGPLTYKKMKLAVLALSSQIKKLPSTHIGVLLPASCGAYIVILAILFARKVPVILNWTLGPRYLDHMVSAANVEAVISSWRFLERLTNVKFGNLTEKLHLLEDIKKNISKIDKVKALLNSKRRAKGLIRSLQLNKVKEEDQAVILFTSGTEANPKGVPLSNHNILANLREAIKSVDLLPTEILYGILPPFHSFGFSVTGIFALLSGMRVAFYPDPTDSFALSEGIARWKITMIAAAPSFLKGILQAAKKEQLKTMRLFVTGAEKTPDEIYKKVKALRDNVLLIEGYGITECAPIVALTDPHEKKEGAGKLLPGIEMITIHSETRKKLSSPHEEGEICLRGPNIFYGYLEKEKDPFIEIDGNKFYCTGDIGYLNENDNLIISGRLKRFSKIGGEMVSLGGIEEIILQKLAEDQKNSDGVPIAVCASEKENGKTELILFTTLDIDKAKINTILQEAGCSRLIKINHVRKIDEIPLMGTGKTDYRFLQKLIE